MNSNIQYIIDNTNSVREDLYFWIFKTLNKIEETESNRIVRYFMSAQNFDSNSHRIAWDLKRHMESI